MLDFVVAVLGLLFARGARSVRATGDPVGGSILVGNELLAMDVAALVVSIVSLVISTVIAVRQRRWQRLIAKLERLDPREALDLQRECLERHTYGWTRWGRGPRDEP